MLPLSTTGASIKTKVTLLKEPVKFCIDCLFFLCYSMVIPKIQGDGNVKKDWQALIELLRKEEPTERISNREYYMIEKTGYSFHFFCIHPSDRGIDHVTEMKYDLRYRKFFIKRNFNEVSFNVANLDRVVPRKLQYSYTNFHSSENIPKFFDMVSVEENEGMYREMVEIIGAIGEETQNMTSRALIRLITDYHLLELIYKSKLIKNMENVIGLNSHLRRKIQQASYQGETKIHKVFGLTRSQLNFALEFKHQLGDVALGAMLGENNLCNVTQKQMDDYRAYVQKVKEWEEEFLIEKMDLFTQGGNINQYVKDVTKTNYSEDNLFGFIRATQHPNPKKLLRYLLFEVHVSQGIQRYHDALNIYRDYYKMCKDMEYTNFDRYPSHLKTSHDIVAMNYRFVADEMAEKKFSAAADKVNSWDDKYKKNYIVTPTSAQEVVTEGNVLHHCVASYVSKVVKGTTHILFLREKKDTPQVTVEIRGDQIVQARGSFNRSISPVERESLAYFAKKNDLKMKV